MKRKFHLLSACIYLLFFLLILKWVIFGSLYHYIAPKMSNFIYLYAFFMLVMSIFQVYRVISFSKKDSHSHLHCDCHPKKTNKWREINVHVVLLIPLVLGFGFPDKTLDSTIAEKRTVSSNNLNAANIPNANIENEESKTYASDFSPNTDQSNDAAIATNADDVMSKNIAKDVTKDASDKTNTTDIASKVDDTKNDNITADGIKDAGSKSNTDQQKITKTNVDEKKDASVATTSIRTKDNNVTNSKIGDINNSNNQQKVDKNSAANTVQKINNRNESNSIQGINNSSLNDQSETGYNQTAIKIMQTRMGIGANDSTTTNEKANQQNGKIIVNDDNYADVMGQLFDNPNQYVGKEIELTGFVLHNKDFKDDQIFVARYVITCCICRCYSNLCRCTEQ